MNLDYFDDKVNNTKENLSNRIIRILILMCENQKEELAKMKSIKEKNEKRVQLLEDSETAAYLAKKYLFDQVSIQNLKEEIGIFTQEEQKLHNEINILIKIKVIFLIKSNQINSL